MSVFLYPFKSNSITEQEITIWAVNTDEPHNAFNSVITAEECPNCAERHVYKFVDEPFNELDDKKNKKVILSYKCKCATCRKQFTAKIEINY